jgi:hypothetical protein
MRHMVGGPSALAQDERLLRFVFPERPGALMKFLSLMRPGWNISLFHYRNHGSDHGRVLAGLQVPDADLEEFLAFLGALGYPNRLGNLNSGAQYYFTIGSIDSFERNLDIAQRELGRLELACLDLLVVAQLEQPAQVRREHTARDR